jgi:hypothetical protein
MPILISRIQSQQRKKPPVHRKEGGLYCLLNSATPLVCLLRLAFATAAAVLLLVPALGGACVGVTSSSCSALAAAEPKLPLGMPAMLSRFTAGGAAARLSLLLCRPKLSMLVLGGNLPVLAAAAAAEVEEAAVVQGPGW